MNNRQGKNSRQSSNLNIQQQKNRGNRPANDFSKSGFNYQSAGNRNDNRNRQGDVWAWENSGSSREQIQGGNMTQMNQQGIYSGYGSARNPAPKNSSMNFNSQPSNFNSQSSNFGYPSNFGSSSSFSQSSNFQSPAFNNFEQNQTPALSTLLSNLTANNFSRQQNASQNMNMNSQRSSDMNRLFQKREQISDRRGNTGNNKQTQRDHANFRQNQNQSANSRLNRGGSGNQRQAAGGALGNERQRNTEVYPDIGEPKIKPRFEDVFEFVKKNESGIQVFMCRVCKIEYLPEKNIKTHLEGKKHKYHLKLVEDSLPGKTKFQKEQAFKQAFGTTQITQLQPKFDIIVGVIKKPLVALEYIVEVLNSSCKESFYVCTMCDKRCDPRTVELHLVSHSHKINYLSKHFTPIAVRLQTYRRFMEDSVFKEQTLNSICSKIEAKFGRKTAFIYEGQDFYDMQSDIIETIENKQHDTIDQFENAENILLQGINLNDEKWLAENPPKPPRPEVKRELPEGTKRKRKVPKNVIEDYKVAVAKVTRELEEKLKGYENDPDSHPSYKREWEEFWKKKVEEMSKRGEDPTGHSFHDEWCEYFLLRIRELHKHEVKWKCDTIRKDLGLMLEDIEDGVDPKRSRGDDSEEEREQLFSDRKGRFYVSDDDGSFDEDYREFGPRIPKDVLYVKENKIFNKFLGDVGIDSASRPKPKQPPKKVEKPKVDRSLPNFEKKPEPLNEPTTLIKTCRLLTSLEQELGLLAPKVLDLLSRGLAFERENSKPADELLFDSENFNLIETVKEKIIGMQMANLIVNNRKNAVEKALGETNKLIEQHEILVNIKKTLKDMGKDDPSTEEIEMLRGMFKKGNKDVKDIIKEKEFPGTSNAGTENIDNI